MKRETRQGNGKAGLQCHLLQPRFPGRHPWPQFQCQSCSQTWRWRHSQRPLWDLSPMHGAVHLLCDPSTHISSREGQGLHPQEWQRWLGLHQPSVKEPALSQLPVPPTFFLRVSYRQIYNFERHYLHDGWPQQPPARWRKVTWPARRRALALSCQQQEGPGDYI